MKYKIKREIEVITGIVSDSDITASCRTVTNSIPTICDGEDELIEAVVEKTLEHMERHVIDYNLTYPEDAFICGFDNRGVGFQSNGQSVQYVRTIEFDIKQKLDDPQGTCNAIARRLNDTVCDDNAIVMYNMWRKKIEVLPPSGAYHLINKKHSEISS